MQEDDALDVEIIALLRDTVLPETASASQRGSSRAGTDVTVPPERLRAIFTFLRRGAGAALTRTQSDDVADMAADSTTEDNSVAGSKSGASGPRVREQLARACIQALVDTTDHANGSEYTVLTPASALDAAASGHETADGSVDSAIAAPTTLPGSEPTTRAATGNSAEDLLATCEATLQRFQTAARAAAGAPLSDALLSEANFVISTSASLVSLRHRSAALRLFPHLVACVPSLVGARRDVAEALAQVLAKYAMFLA